MSDQCRPGLLPPFFCGNIKEIWKEYIGWLLTYFDDEMNCQTRKDQG